MSNSDEPVFFKVTLADGSERARVKLSQLREMAAEGLLNEKCFVQETERSYIAPVADYVKMIQAGAFVPEERKKSYVRLQLAGGLIFLAGLDGLAKLLQAETPPGWPAWVILSTRFVLPALLFVGRARRWALIPALLSMFEVVAGFSRMQRLAEWGWVAGGACYVASVIYLLANRKLDRHIDYLAFALGLVGLGASLVFPFPTGIR